MKKKMYIEPGGGLCNRIGVFNYGIKLADKYGFEPIIVWKNNGEIACNYEDIFRNERKIKVKNLYYPIGSSKGMLKSGKVLSSLKCLFFTHKSELYRKRLLKREIELLDGTDMERSEANRLNEEAIQNTNLDWIFVNTYQCAEMDYDYSTIKFADKFNNIVEGIIGKDTSSIIGVHIRRMDHSYAIDANPIGNFIVKMQKAIDTNPNVKFYVASDDADVIRTLKEKFAERIIINEGAVLTRQSKEGIENAVIDLLALSKSSHIIGSKGSTFSDVASFIGGNSLEYADQI